MCSIVSNRLMGSVGHNLYHMEKHIFWRGNHLFFVQNSKAMNKRILKCVRSIYRM